MKYIGIDFGDGTTSASLLATDARNNAFQDDKGEPLPPQVKEIINEGHNQDRTEVPSLLAYPVDKHGEFDPSRPCLVGTSAAESVQDDYELRSNWKTRPTRQEETPGYSREAKIEDMKRFMSTVWALYQGTNGQQDAKDVKIVIGAPSGWNEDDRKAYACWATEAGLPNVTVLSESTAAFLYSRKFLSYVGANGKSLHVSDDMLKNGILLVDLGSSTTDFTYARGMYESRHWGYPLGAKYIDEAVLRFNLNRIGGTGGDAENLSRILFSEENLELKSRVLFKCRALKEKFFTNKASAGGKPVVVSNRESVPFGEQWIDFYIFDENSPARTVAPTFWNDLLEKGCKPDFQSAPMPDGRNKGPWRVSFRSALAYVKEHVVKPGNGAGLTIILTGGASRMDFVEADIKSVFGQNVPLLVGASNDRAFSVANGLAWAGYAQDKIDAAEKDIRQRTKAFMGSSPARQKIRESVISPSAKFLAKRLARGLAGQMSSDPESANTKRKQEKASKQLADRLFNGDDWKDEVAKCVRVVLTGTSTDKPPLRGLLEEPEIAGLTRDLQKEFSRVSIAPRDVTLPATSEIAFKANIDGVLDKAKRTAFGNFMHFVNILLNPLGALWNLLFVNPDAIIGKAAMDMQIKNLLTESYVNKISKSVEKGLCAGGNSFLDALVASLTDAVAGTKQDEMKALRGQFADAQ